MAKTRRISPGPATRAPAPATIQTLAGRDRPFFASRWYSLRAALAGVVHTLRTQPNAWIEVTAIVVVLLAGWWFAITRGEWLALVIICSMILALEAVNTAVEATVDLVSPHYHPLAKIAKDAAAGAFYRHFSFLPLQQQPTRLYLPMKTVVELFGN